MLYACGSEKSEEFVKLMGARDAGSNSDGGMTSGSECADVTIDSDSVEVHDDAVTAHFAIVESATRTVMLFGGEVVTFDNAVSSVGIIGLDREDALMLAMKYDDFYLCSSEGGMEAGKYILPFDLIPANCEIHRQIADALDNYERNSRAGGDRVSLIFEGARLELESAAFDSSGEDVKDHFADYNFHLVTKVEQVTGQSVLEFGMQ